MRPEQVIDGISVVDYGGFVDLTEQHDKVQAWV
jgi:tRNA 2-thiouridine synthesizing protein B